MLIVLVARPGIETNVTPQNLTKKKQTKKKEIWIKGEKAKT